MDEKQIQERIENYLDGKMQTSEKSAFEEELKNDPALSEALQYERAARLTIQEVSRDQLQIRLNKFEEEWQNTQSPSTFINLKSRRFMVIAAALMALVTAVIWLFQKPTFSELDLFAIHFEPYRPIAPTRGHEEISDWDKATESYAKQEYITAATLFEESLNEDNTIPYLAHFYLGNSLLSQQPSQPELAINSLNEVLKSDNDYQQQALWYKSLALIKLEKHNEAKGLLNKLMEINNFKAKEAQILLNQLNTNE